MFTQNELNFLKKRWTSTRKRVAFQARDAAKHAGWRRLRAPGGLRPLLELPNQEPHCSNALRGAKKDVKSRERTQGFIENTGFSQKCSLKTNSILPRKDALQHEKE
jgi:hypothetical protein